MQPIFLIGYMGCGKSTFGRKLARSLGFRFVDTDALIEERQGASVADIFQYEGEERFRAAEREALEEAVAGGGDVVVSTGGGMPVWHDNMERMNGTGHTFYLRRKPSQILHRLSPYGRQKRYRLRGMDDEELLAFMERDLTNREPVYSQAHYAIDCDTMSDDEALQYMLELIQRL